MTRRVLTDTTDSSEHDTNYSINTLKEAGFCTMPTEDDCQTNQPNNQFPIESELRLPLDSSMRILFTGFFNGFSVELHSAEEIALLYHMGFFGKSSQARSRPKLDQNNDSPKIMRKRQFLKRTFWHKKFGGAPEPQADEFLQEVDTLTAKIIADGDKELNKDVIDLVSSDEDITEVSSDELNSHSMSSDDPQDMVVIVPNSDSEGENYFENFKPKCCINKVRLQEKLMLTLQEAFFLVYGIGCLQILDDDQHVLSVDQCWQLFTNTDRNFVEKYVVYHYFRSKGYIVKPGIKFGGDYLLYKEGPGINHADYIAVIRSDKNKSEYSWTTTLGHVRMATTTVKEILIAEVKLAVALKEPVDMPKGLHNYSVREILLSRNIPVTINDDHID